MPISDSAAASDPHPHDNPIINNNNNLIYIAPACRMTSEALRIQATYKICVAIRFFPNETRTFLNLITCSLVKKYAFKFK